MSGIEWQGVFPAVTTKFTEDDRLDVAEIERHIDWQIESGVHGIIVCGSLGENGTLDGAEKREIVRAAVRAAGGRVPVVATCAETSTRASARFAEDAAKEGARGLMVLPGIPYRSDARETMTHYRAVARSGALPVMIYNNPVAYGVDITPAMLAEMAEEPAFAAVKESSDDIRRLTDIRNLVGNRYRLFAGVDDLALESLLVGADGWVAGLVCAFPRETVRLYDLARAGRIEEARRLYAWFMPLLHLDVSTKLVQNIKLAEAMAGVGDERVRAPRLPLAGDERARVKAVIARALETRPSL